MTYKQLMERLRSMINEHPEVAGQQIKIELRNEDTGELSVQYLLNIFVVTRDEVSGIMCPHCKAGIDAGRLEYGQAYLE